MVKKMITQVGEALLGIPRMMVGLPSVQRKSGKVTLLYSGECSIDEAVERASHLKSARDKINKKYLEQVRCYAGSGSNGFYGADLGIPADGIYELSRYYIVNLEEVGENDSFDILRNATLNFVSFVPEKVAISLYSHKGLEREIKNALLKTDKYHTNYMEINKK